LPEFAIEVHVIMVKVASLEALFHPKKKLLSNLQ
jgi:hypothetical protein